MDGVILAAPHFDRQCSVVVFNYILRSQMRSSFCRRTTIWNRGSSSTWDSSSAKAASEVCPESGRGTFQDVRDGQVYKYITIGDRVWMDQNLNYPVETSTCYDEQQSNCDIYGRLYSVQYMNDKQKNFGTFNLDIIDSICPHGWRVPTLAECFYNNPSTGDPDPLFYEDLGEGFRTWLTSTYTEHGRMKIFSPDYEDRVDSFLVKKQKAITLFAV